MTYLSLWTAFLSIMRNKVNIWETILVKPNKLGIQLNEIFDRKSFGMSEQRMEVIWIMNELWEENPER